MSEIRYQKITLVDGTRFILRITSETARFVNGVEVDSDGEEVVPRGADAQGRRYHQRERHVERGTIKKTVPLRMNTTYATLEVVPTRAGARKRVEPEIQQLRKDVRLWWQIAKAEMRAGFRGGVDAMDRAIAIEKKIVALGAAPPRRPKDFA